MKTHLRVFAIVVFILVIGCGTASAYSKSESMQSVVINMDGAPRMVSTDKETVGELLEDLADTIDTEFYLEDAKESDPIEAMMTLSLTSVTEKTVATTEAIAYKTVERTNSSLKAGESRVVQDMRKGSKWLSAFLESYRPLLDGERYLTDGEVAELLRVSRRTLQEYRNNRVLPFILLGGKVLYPETGLREVLEANYRKPLE